jgi:Mg-chelatase subunit ChlD
MVIRFESTASGRVRATFFTAVAAAERFIRRRERSSRDLVALTTGNFAYVVTPFTNDYENMLRRAISDPREWGRFPDWGTTIIEGIDQATQLFKTFDFVNASGNLMIVITDGRDSQLNQQSGALERMVAETREWRIPVYMMRTAYNRREGEVLQDKIWRSTVERTGGRFYAIYDDESVTRALREIDRLSPGRIETREYSVARPRYAGYALIASGLWLLAAFLKLNFGVFRTFP